MEIIDKLIEDEQRMAEGCRGISDHHRKQAEQALQDCERHERRLGELQRIRRLLSLAMIHGLDRSQGSELGGQGEGP